MSHIGQDVFKDSNYAQCPFWVFLSKIVIYGLRLFQFCLAYQELSGYVSHISLVLHTYTQKVQENRHFAVLLENPDFCYCQKLANR